jgi:hypothetical protein
MFDGFIETGAKLLKGLERNYFSIFSKIRFMGLVYADIELINGGDLEMARRR